MRLTTVFIFAAIAAIFLCGCGGPTRFYTHVHDGRTGVAPKFTSAVIEAPYSEDEQRIARALAAYFEIVTRADVRVKGIEDKTMILEYTGSRGIFSCSTRFMIREYEGEIRQARVVQIIEKAGMFWSGQERSFIKALKTLDEEAAMLSTRVSK